MQRISLSLGVLGTFCLVVQNLAAESRVLGGTSGQPWNGGGGEIPTAVQISVDEAAITNTPGDVVDFDFPGKPGWVFPQRADSTRNIAAGATLTSPNLLTLGLAEELLLMVDGDLETAFTRKSEAGGPQVLAFGAMIDFDLGARFGVNRVQFFPRNAPGFAAPDFPFQNDYLRAYELLVNDGSENARDESGRPVMTSFKLELQNDQPVVDLRIPPQYLRFLRLRSQTSIGFEIAEFRVFGTGFVPEAQYISNVYDLGSNWGVWGKIRWLEESLGLAGMAQARIATRAGHDDTPLEFTRPGPGGSVNLPWKEGAVATTAAGEQIALDDLEPLDALRAYRALPLTEKNQVALSLEDYRGLRSRGEIRDDPDAWTPWSAPYGQEGTSGITVENIDDEQLGAVISTPAPRRYFQVRVELASRDLEAATGVGQLAFTVFPPAAERIVGEIYPRRVELGVPATFTYAVMPTRIRPGQDSGFDTFEIATPVRVEAIDSIQVLFHDGHIEAADFSSSRSEPVGTAHRSGRRLRHRGGGGTAIPGALPAHNGQRPGGRRGRRPEDSVSLPRPQIRDDLYRVGRQHRDRDHRSEDPRRQRGPPRPRGRHLSSGGNGGSAGAVGRCALFGRRRPDQYPGRTAAPQPQRRRGQRPDSHLLRPVARDRSRTR